MPDYRFVLQWPDREEDHREGVRNSIDNRAARDLARRLARQLRDSGEADLGLALVVKDADENDLLRIPIRK
jgi:hypothetical protein